MTKLVVGESHKSEKGKKFAHKVMNYLRETTDRWKAETNIGLYDTPAESLCYRFARIDKEFFGEIPDLTDKGHYTNNYYMDVRDSINVFEKYDFESKFQPISSGGCISYAEVPNITLKNPMILEFNCCR